MDLANWKVEQKEKISGRCKKFEKRGKMSSAGGERGRTLRSRPLTASIRDDHSKTLCREYLENGECSGWEK
jgi:hypothetical protein